MSPARLDEAASRFVYPAFMRRQGLGRLLEVRGLAVVLAVYAMLFGRAATYGYVWDDQPNIVDSEYLGRDFWGGLVATQQRQLSAELVSHAHLRLAHDSYRPLLFASYALDVALFGKSPVALHVHNLLLGALAIALVFAASRRLLRRESDALAASAIFALHPLQVEPLAYVSARSDLLAGALALVAALCVLARGEAPGGRDAAPRRAGPWLVVGAFFATLASLLAKESSLGLPLGLAGLLIAVDAPRRAAPAVLASAVGVAAYLALRVLVLGATAAPSSGPVAEALAGHPFMSARYAQLFLLPFDLSIERLYLAPHASVLALALLGAGAALFGAVLARKALLALLRRCYELRVALAGVIWALGLLGPSSIVVVIQDVLADRYAYLPLWGYALASVALARTLVSRRPALRPLVLTAGALWAVMLVFVAHMQVRVWSDNLTLYAHAVRMEPESGMAHYRLGHALAKRGRWRPARDAFERAAQLAPEDAAIQNNLAVAYLETGALARAEAAIQKSLRVSQGQHHRAWFNLGMLRFAQDRKGEACEAISRAVALNSAYARARDTHAALCGAEARSH